jgi:hypothetical protein
LGWWRGKTKDMGINKPLDSLQESDLQTLIDNQVSEGKTIEYKDILPGNADSKKRGLHGRDKELS